MDGHAVGIGQPLGNSCAVPVLSAGIYGKSSKGRGSARFPNIELGTGRASQNSFRAFEIEPSSSRVRSASRASSSQGKTSFVLSAKRVFAMVESVVGGIVASLIITRAMPGTSGSNNQKETRP